MYTYMHNKFVLTQNKNVNNNKKLKVLKYTKLCKLVYAKIYNMFRCDPAELSPLPLFTQCGVLERLSERWPLNFDPNPLIPSRVAGWWKHNTYSSGRQVLTGYVSQWLWCSSWTGKTSGPRWHEVTGVGGVEWFVLKNWALAYPHKFYQVSSANWSVLARSWVLLPSLCALQHDTSSIRLVSQLEECEHSSCSPLSVWGSVFLGISFQWNSSEWPCRCRWSTSHVFLQESTLFVLKIYVTPSFLR